MRAVYAIILLFCMALAGCETGDKKEGDTPGDAQAQKCESLEPRSHVDADTTAGDKSDAQIMLMDKNQAARILDFYNAAQPVLDKGYFALPHKLFNNVFYYEKTFKLPPRRRSPDRKNALFTLGAPKGLFDKAEEDILTKSLLGMDKALLEMIGQYGNLEKYVADTRIKDDGKKGADLSRQLKSLHGQFMDARKSWLEVVEKKAESAEAALLANHPLQRKIMDARTILRGVKEAQEMVKSGSPNRQNLEAVRQDIIAAMADGEKPPFQAQPYIERQYRLFLKCAEQYANALGNAINEGVYGAQRRELNAASRRCQNAYNAFARQLNAGK